MTLASRTITRPLPAAKSAGWIATGIASLVAHARARLRWARDESELRALPDELLADIGVDRSAIERPRPTMEVDGALMRRLMSLQ